MQAGDRTARALDFAVLAARESEHRAVQLLLDSRSDDADHPLVPVGVEQCDSGIVAGGDLFKVGECLRLHSRFDVLALAVERVELLRDRQRARRIVGNQALDA